jgi:Ca2+-binding EF-hand superfamily protein
MSKKLTPEEAEKLKICLKEAFDHFDADKSGNIDAKEFENAARKFNETGQTKMSEAKIKESATEFIKLADRDADGKVSFYEFYRFMFSALDVKA